MRTLPNVTGYVSRAADQLPREDIMRMLDGIAVRVGLKPVDVLLRLVGPRYTLFFWFFRVSPPAVIAWLGKMRAVRARDHAFRTVPAYRQFREIGRPTNASIGWLNVPFTDKENYIKRFPTPARCVNGVLPMVDTAIDESSGSTGTPYNWVRSLKERSVSHTFIGHFARYCYGTNPWITINAFSMGAWATGMNMGIALQRNSIVKNTGPDMDKILRTLEFFGPKYDYLICGYPPFLKHIIDHARRIGFPLGDYRLMALLGGEGNSEGLRDYLSEFFDPVYSGYGATDIEIGIAGETPLSVAIRRACRDDERLRQAVFGPDSRLPMIFQYSPLMHHIEVNADSELNFTITRLDVLSPRIMYNIHDEGGVATFQDIANTFESVGFELKDLVREVAPSPVVKLPFLWVYGRKDSTVSVMGANIYPEDIEQILYAEPVLAAVTNSFCLSLEERDDGSVRPRLSFEVTSDITKGLRTEFETRIVPGLVDLNADFREAMLEHRDAVMPVVNLHPPGSGPFSNDGNKIKQTRLLR